MTVQINVAARVAAEYELLADQAVFRGDAAQARVLYGLAALWSLRAEAVSA